MFNLMDILTFPEDPSNLKIARNAARAIGADLGEYQDIVAAHILQAALEFRTAAHVQAPGGPAVMEAIENAAKAAAMMANSLDTILAAGITTAANDEERGQNRRILAQQVIVTVAAEFGITAPQWVEDGLNWPLAGRFRKLAHRLVDVRSKLETDDIRLPTRFIDGRELRLIDRLATIYADVVGKSASVWGGGNTAYRQPFGKFVDLTWSLTGETSPPANDALEDRLRAIQAISSKSED
ncbi:hypothetical protein FHS91_003926 [Sphingobium xanthum]|uniref:hypothetical protein n=1 Tax=Sphingobium xanthum TaxID=1387165 RepID=UPI001C8CD661|nr:hypothetical protein [Sphingobium xanthum]